MSWLQSVHYVDAVDSTMHEIRRLAAAGAPHGTSVVADIQTAGRGRRGRPWFSPDRAGLWMTTLIRLTAPCQGVETLSVVAGLAVHQAVVGMGADKVRIKWPNDLVVGPHKMGGILLEAHGLATELPWVGIGIGINLAPRATLNLMVQDATVDQRYIGLQDLLHAHLPLQVLRHRLLTQLLTVLKGYHGIWQAHGLKPLLAFWKQADALLGQPVRAKVGGQVMVGTASGLTLQGQLQVRTPRGMVLVSTGEVESVRPAEMLALS